MVKSLAEVNRKRLSPRTLGFDDTPFCTRPRVAGSEVHAVGIVTTRDRFEGMLYVDGIHQDGLNATDRLAASVLGSKFHAQVHAVLLDGITLGGLNVVDIQRLAARLQRPVIALLRARPDVPAFERAMRSLPHLDMRLARARAAGPVHCIGKWIFQLRCPPRAAQGEGEGGYGCVEATAEDVALFLDACTPEGTQKIAECLRMAHLVGAAIKTGQSSSSA